MAKAASTAEKVKEGSREAGSQNRAPKEDASGPGHAETQQTDSQKQVSAQSIEFTEAVPSVSSVEDKNGGKLNIILDMNVPVSVTIGQVEIPVRQLLQLGPGSVLKLDKPIKEPVDLFLKETKFATADVVVVDNRFAVRIRQIIGVGIG